MEVTEFEKLTQINKDLQEHNVYAYQLELAAALDNEQEYQVAKEFYKNGNYGLSDVIDACTLCKENKQKINHNNLISKFFGM